MLAMGLLLQIAPRVYAGDFNTRIGNASLIQEDGWHKLNADIDFNLSPIAIEALQNSISLVWKIQLKLYQHRSYLWDKEVLDFSIRYRVRYQALLKMYQVKNTTNGEVRRFFSRAAAFKAIGEIRNLKVVRQDAILQPKNLHAALKVQFDREALPLPLRPVSYFNSQWYLSSDWMQWLVQK